VSKIRCRHWRVPVLDKFTYGPKSIPVAPEECRKGNCRHMASYDLPVCQTQLRRMYLTPDHTFLWVRVVVKIVRVATTIGHNQAGGAAAASPAREPRIRIQPPRHHHLARHQPAAGDATGREPVCAGIGPDGWFRPESIREAVRPVRDPALAGMGRPARGQDRQRRRESGWIGVGSRPREAGAAPHKKLIAD